MKDMCHLVSLLLWQTLAAHKRVMTSGIESMYMPGDTFANMRGTMQRQ